MKKIKFPKIDIKNPFKVNLTKKLEGRASIFFGTGNPIKLEKDKLEQVIELFINKYADIVKKVSEESRSVNDSRFSKDRIYDFYQHMEIGTFNFNSGWNGERPTLSVEGVAPAGGDVAVAPIEQPASENANGLNPFASKKKPIEVLNELETVPNPVTLKDLDKNIELLKLKSKLAAQLYTQYNIDAAIQCLENRKKYEENKEFFEKFPYTFSDKIQELLQKYLLVLKPSEIFVPEFPEEAILIMDAYQEMTLRICNKKPTFYVIATNEHFKEKDKKRDPILLVQSPFGFYWQILGAWDEEMILLSEL